MSIFLGTENPLAPNKSRNLFKSVVLDLGISNLSIEGYSGKAFFEISGKDSNNNPSLFTGISFASGKIFSEQLKFVGSYQEGEILNVRLQIEKQKNSTGSFYEFAISNSQEDSDLKFNGYSFIEKYEQFTFKTTGSGFSVRFDPIFKSENVNLNVTTSNFEPSGNLIITIQNLGNQDIPIKTSTIYAANLGFSIEQNITGIITGKTSRAFVSKDIAFYPPDSILPNSIYESSVQKYFTED